MTVVPFWHLLAENGFSLWRSEALAASLVFLAPALLLALVARGRWFYPVLLVCVVIVATYPLRRELSALVSLNPWAGALLVAFGTGLLMLSQRRHFATLLIVFAFAFLGADFLKRAWDSLGESAGSMTRHRAQHCLYMVLDEQIGIAGFPDSIGACISARQAWLAALNEHSFTVYPNAFSNYAVTLESIPSILNRRLLDSADEFSSRRTAGGAVIISPNRLFSDYRGKGYRVAVYQHQSIDYVAGDSKSDREVDYADVVNGLESVPGWKRRFLWLIGNYQGSDPLVSEARAFLPFRLGYRKTGPLAVRSAWPSRLAADMAAATRPTLFFVHLMIPHEPYVYRRDGSVRDDIDWTDDQPSAPLAATVYRDRYQRYCEQSEYVSAELNAFLDELARSGQLDQMTVVIHGDHGSRIRRQFEGSRTASRRPPDADDYVEAPPAGDLLDRFSTLLCIRKPRATMPNVVEAKHSVLSFLASDFYGDKQGLDDRLNAVYLFRQNGTAKEIPLLTYWR